MPFPFMAVGAAVSGIASIFGGVSEANAANAQQEKLDEYNKKLWNFNWREAQRDYRYAVRGTNILRRNTEAELGWRDATAQQDYRYQLAIADAQDRTNAAAYQKSLQTYGLQKSFNNMAAASAYAAENRKLQEAVTEMSFQNQDITVKSLQEAGMAQARGASGRSAGKELHAVLAAAGRNQAILAESLVSAKANFNQANNKIATDKYGADLNAWANVMVKPIAAARPESPLSMPRPEIQNPQKPKKPPKPVTGAQVSPWSAGITAGLGAAGNIIGAFQK